MANTVYPLAKAAFLSGTVNLPSNTINVQMYAGTAYNAAHDFLDDLTGTKIGSAVTITGKSVTSGQFSGTVPSITATAGSNVNALIVYVDGANDAARRLLAYLDRKGDGTALAFTTTGATNTFTWAGPIFSIGGG